MNYFALGRLAAFAAVGIVVAIMSLFRTPDGPAQYVAVQAQTYAVSYSCRPRAASREEAAAAEELWEDCEKLGWTPPNTDLIRRAEIEVRFTSPIDNRSYDDAAVMYTGEGFPAPPKAGDAVTIRMNTQNPHDFSIG